MVQWLEETAAVPKVPGSNSWKCIDVKLSVLGPPPVAERFCTKKTGRREVPGPIPSHACRPSCSEFFVVFSEVHVNTGQGPLERSPMEGIPPIGPGPPVRQLALKLTPLPVWDQAFLSFKN